MTLITWSWIDDSTCTSYLTPRAHPRMLSRSQAFAAAFSAKKALLNVNATVNAKRTFTFTSAMIPSAARARLGLD